jgi:DNA-binding HxlR family transcriptional regulator
MQVRNAAKPGTANRASARPKAKPKAKPAGFPRSPCAVACTLDLVGDKWSLLVVRDLFRGKATYGELQRSPEAIPTNILADRLKKLQQAALITRTAYQDHPVRHAYELTEKGKALGDVLRALVHWGTRHIPGTQVMAAPPPHSAPTNTPAASGPSKRK